MAAEFAIYPAHLAPPTPARDTPSELTVPEGMRRWRYSAMGTTLTVLAPKVAPGAGPLVQALFDEWDCRFSRFRPDSELSLVNASSGRPVPVSQAFAEVTRAALAAAAATDGLFDPTLGARIVALGYDRTFAELPADRSISRALAPWASGAWRSIVVDPEAHTVRVPFGAALDFGGIAKGMAVDAAIELLASLWEGPVAVDAGGDLAVRGTPPGLDAWPIALVDADDAPTVRLDNGALASSSIARRRWRVGHEERHHLLDPRTGEPAASGLRAVSVVAPSCRVAEVAAKVALLLGPEGGPAFLDRHSLAGVLVGDDGMSTPVGSWRAVAVGRGEGIPA